MSFWDLFRDKNRVVLNSEQQKMVDVAASQTYLEKAKEMAKVKARKQAEKDFGENQGFL